MPRPDRWLRLALNGVAPWALCAAVYCGLDGANAGAADGQTIYANTCSVCHTNPYTRLECASVTRINLLRPDRFSFHQNVATYPTQVVDQIALASYLSNLDTSNSYSMGGVVQTAAGQGIYGVTVTLTSAYLPTRASASSSSGGYLVPDLRPGDYVVTPFKSGYLFTPSSHFLARAFGVAYVDTNYASADPSKVNFTGAFVGFGLTVTPTNEAGTGLPGTTVSYSLLVTNQGGAPDSFEVTLSSNRWVVTAPPSLGPVATNTGIALPIAVTVPADAVFGDTDLAGITVTSRADPTKSVTVSLSTAASLGSGTWGGRNSTTSQGQVLWMDPGGNDVFFFDGTAVTRLQAGDTNGDGVNDLGGIQNFLFSLGGGAAPGEVIAVWRRGEDFAWLWRTGADPVLITATNPVNPDPAKPTLQGMNPEAVAIADGSVFLALQAGGSGGQPFVRNVFRVDPASGTTTNLTGATAVYGFELPLLTSRGQAAWLWDDGTREVVNNQTNKVYKLEFYDGATVQEIDGASTLTSPSLNQGRLVYVKAVAGVSQVFLYDNTATNPSPVPLTADTAGANGLPRTDGQHVAWIHTEPNGTTRNIILNGGLTLTHDPATQPGTPGPADQNAFQCKRGQLLWTDVAGALRDFDGRGISTVASPAQFSLPWLADGFVAYLSRVGVLRYSGSPSADAEPAPPILVQAVMAPGQVTVAWDQILGATSYNLYLAWVPGVTRDNYQSLPGGRKVAGATSPLTLTDVTNRTYSFTVSAVRDGVEGPSSTAVSGTWWSLVPGLSNVAFHAVAADAADGLVAYAAGGTNVYKTTDGGGTWEPLTGGIAGRDVRALAVNGPRVYAATRDFFNGPPAQVWRSTNGGGSWEAIVPQGGAIGELTKSIAIDPTSPTTLYAADFTLANWTPGDSYVIKSTDGGATWTQLPGSDSGEIRAYALALDPRTTGTLYAGGTGVPLVKTTDGGQHWTDVSPGPGYVDAVAIDPAQTTTLYAGQVDFTQTSLGLWKSTNGALSWAQMNAGFPAPPPQINALLIDPANPAVIHAGAGAGYFFSTDGGQHWTAGDGGLISPEQQSIAALALTGSGRLIAATGAGLFVLDVSVPLAPPTLGLRHTSGSGWLLSWPASAEGFVIESTSSLLPQSNWIVDTNLPAVSGAEKTLPIDTLSAARFYRLRRP